MTAECGVPWIAQCEEGWVPHGDASSMDVCTDGPAFGVEIHPGAVGLHGLSRSVVLTPGTERVVWEATLDVLTPDTGIGMRLVFRDHQGVAVVTISDTQTFGVGRRTLSQLVTVPVGAVSVDVQIAGDTWGSSFWVDRLQLLEQEAPGKDQSDCDQMAESWRMARYNACYADNDIPTGKCIGTPDASAPGGSTVECKIVCLHTGASAPAEKQCSLGF